MTISLTCDIEINAVSCYMEKLAWNVWNILLVLGMDVTPALVIQPDCPSARWRASSPPAPCCVIKATLWLMNLWLLQRTTQRHAASLKGDPIRPEGWHDYMRPSCAPSPWLPSACGLTHRSAGLSLGHKWATLQWISCVNAQRRLCHTWSFYRMHLGFQLAFNIPFAFSQHFCVIN